MGKLVNSSLSDLWSTRAVQNILGLKKPLTIPQVVQTTFVTKNVRCVLNIEIWSFAIPDQGAPGAADISGAIRFSTIGPGGYDTNDSEESIRDIATLFLSTLGCAKGPLSKAERQFKSSQELNALLRAIELSIVKR